MNEHFQPSNHAIFILFQQQITLLHLRRHQLLVEVALQAKQQYLVRETALLVIVQQFVSTANGKQHDLYILFTMIMLNQSGVG